VLYTTRCYDRLLSTCKEMNDALSDCLLLCRIRVGQPSGQHRCLPGGIGETQKREEMISCQTTDAITTAVEGWTRELMSQRDSHEFSIFHASLHPPVKAGHPFITRQGGEDGDRRQVWRIKDDRLHEWISSLYFSFFFCIFDNRHLTTKDHDIA